MKCSPLLVYFVLSNLAILIYLPVLFVINSKEQVSAPFDQTELLRKVTPHLPLTGGRRLSYMEYGSINAKNASLVFLLGSPGSRLFRHPDVDTIAAQSGIRLVSIDRPGIGLSDLHSEDLAVPAARAQRVAHDLLSLARHLGHQQFSVLGVSAGAPYAIASAKQLGAAIVPNVTLISPLFSPTAAVTVTTHPRLTSLFPLIYHATQFMLPLNIQRPVFRWLGKAAAVWGNAAVPSAQSKETVLQWVRENPADGPVLVDPAWGRIVDRSLVEICRMGTDGLAAEMAAHTHFTVDNLGRLSSRVRVVVHHGGQDVYVDAATIEALREKVLPDNAHVHRHAGYGHLGVFAAEFQTVMNVIGGSSF